MLLQIILDDLIRTKRTPSAKLTEGALLLALLEHQGACGTVSHRGRSPILDGARIDKAGLTSPLIAMLHILLEGCTIEFNKAGELLKVDCKLTEVPSALIPESVQAYVKANFPNIQGEIMINSIGTVIGSHTGPGTVALFFFGDERID